MILAPKLNLDEFLVGTYSTGTKRYLKTGDVIKNLIKINANDSNYLPSTIYVDCEIGLVITLKWADNTKNEMVGSKITVQAPWNSTSNKLLYFTCKDSGGNIIDVNVNDNFVDESGSFTKSTISKNTNSNVILASTGTHTLNLKSNSSVSIGTYKIGIKYHEYKQISAIINITSTVSNIRFYKYTTNIVPEGDGYILSTSSDIIVSDSSELLQKESIGGIAWLSVRYTAGSYKFIDGIVYNKNCDIYTNISDEPTIGTNLQWGSVLYILTPRGNGVYKSVGGGFAFASSWSHLLTTQT